LSKRNGGETGTQEKGRKRNKGGRLTERNLELVNQKLKKGGDHCRNADSERKSRTGESSQGPRTAPSQRTTGVERQAKKKHKKRGRKERKDVVPRTKKQGADE